MDKPKMLLLILITFISIETTLAQETTTDHLVLVRRIVPANFHDADFDQIKLDSLLKNSASRIIKVEPQSNISKILKEQYNISKSWTPSIYEKMESAILDLNGINDPNRDLKSGKTIKLPDLPRTSQIVFKSGIANKLKTKSTLAVDWNQDFQAFNGYPVLNKNSPYGGQKELQLRLLPESALTSLALPNSRETRETLIDNSEYQVMQEPMSLTLSGNTESSNSFALLTQTEKEALSQVLSRPAKTRPLLVILDDSYPSQADFYNTAKFVIDASREIRRKFRLVDDKHRDSEELINLEKNYQNGTIFCDEDCEYPKLKMHSSMIKESLREFTDIDKNKRIEVIYLPVNAIQAYSKAILSEILNVSLLADSLTDGLLLDTSEIKPLAGLRGGQQPDYENVNYQVKTLLKSSSLYGALSPFQGRVMVTQTDRAILDGVINFLWLYSMASQRPHFISMSWTSPNLKYPVLFRANGYGLWLAAAGNEKGVNVHSALLQFAARSSDPGDVLAVENTSSACENSTFTSTTDVPVFGFAFFGRVSSDLCGTSFSTPRIAWLLAANEAIKGQIIHPYTDQWNNWRVIKKTHLMGLQKSQKTGEERYAVTAWDLLEEPIPK